MLKIQVQSCSKAFWDISFEFLSLSWIHQSAYLLSLLEKLCYNRVIGVFINWFTKFPAEKAPAAVISTRVTQTRETDY